MKALLYTSPNTLEWRDQPEPAPGNDEAMGYRVAWAYCDAAGWCERRPPVVRPKQAAMAT
jgi:hypothetical protein